MPHMPHTPFPLHVTGSSLGTPPQGYRGPSIDLWSLGVCLYAMLCGCLPFDEPETEALYDQVILFLSV